MSEVTHEQVLEYCRKRCLVLMDREFFEHLKRWPADMVEVVRCKDCKHRPYSTEPGKTYGLTIEAPDGRCPCYNEDDGWYSWVPDNEFFCFYGERKEGEE